MSKEQVTKITYQLDVESKDVDKAIDNVKRLEKEIKNVNKVSLLVNRDARTSLINERKKYYKDENRRREELHISKDKYWKEKASHERFNNIIKEERINIAKERNRLRAEELKLMAEGKYVGPMRTGKPKKDRAGRGSRRPFEAMMMAIGSFMLLQYAAKMPVMWAGALGDAMASVETDTRKGRAYRQSLINKNISTANFDKAVSRYSEISGEQGYMARKRIASMYGMLDQKNINASALNPEQLAMIMQGLTVGMGMSDEQADKKLVELLSGKISKEDKKTFGIKSRTPVQILEEINTSLQKNPVTASVMTGESAVAHMKFIRGAKNEMLSRIDDLWSGLFTQITGPMKEFTKTFFGLDNKLVLGEWITTFATIRDQIEKVFTKKNAEKLAIFTNRFISIMSMLIGTIGKFLIEHPWLSLMIGGTGIAVKSEHGSIFGYLYDKLLGKNENSDGQRVFVTNMPKNFGGVDIPGKPKDIISEITSNKGLYAIAATIGVVAGTKFGTWFAETKLGKSIGERFYTERNIGKLDQYMINAGLSREERERFYTMYRNDNTIDVFKYIRDTLGPKGLARYNSLLNALEKVKNDSLLESSPLLEGMDLSPIGRIRNSAPINYITATNIYMNGKDTEINTLINGSAILGGI